MEHKYRIGSFNLHNIGAGAFKNDRNLETIAKIIKEEELDIVALQEVLSKGKVFDAKDTPSKYVKRSILAHLGGEDEWGFDWVDADDKSPRHEGYGFLWNKLRISLPVVEVSRKGRTFDRTFTPRRCRLNHDEMQRVPGYGRFILNSCKKTEIRLICVHTWYGSANKDDKEIRERELRILLTDIYPQVEDRCYKGDGTKYTIMLGDYNAVLENDDLSGNSKLLTIKEYVQSARYGCAVVKTVQSEKTTLKKITNSEGEDKFNGDGYVSNYDHFSYNKNTFEKLDRVKEYRVDAVQKYCEGNFETYFKTVSDHVPIIIELEI